MAQTGTIPDPTLATPNRRPSRDPRSNSLYRRPFTHWATIEAIFFDHRLGATLSAIPGNTGNGAIIVVASSACLCTLGGKMCWCRRACWSPCLPLLLAVHDTSLRSIPLMGSSCSKSSKPNGRFGYSPGGALISLNNPRRGHSRFAFARTSLR